MVFCPVINLPFTLEFGGFQPFKMERRSSLPPKNSDVDIVEAERIIFIVNQELHNQL